MGPPHIAISPKSPAIFMRPLYTDLTGVIPPCATIGAMPEVSPEQVKSLRQTLGAKSN
jgi:hypothetical protein